MPCPGARPRRIRPALRALAVAAGAGAALSGACAASPPCARGQALCGAASWIPASGATGVEGRMFVARATEVDGRAVRTADEALPVGSAPVVLRFDVAGVGGPGNVERAVLALAPHPAWRTGARPVRVTARAVSSAFTDDPRASGGPHLTSDPAGEVQLSGRTRTPVRLDVTAAVRAWQSGGATPGGLAVAADGAGVVFAGLGALDPADRPRLELVIR